MRNLLIGCSVTMLMIAATPAPAAQEPGSNHAPPAVTSQVVANESGAIGPVAGGKPEAVAERKICRQLPSSYSRMTEKVCLTAKQWEQVERDSR